MAARYLDVSIRIKFPLDITDDEKKDARDGIALFLSSSETQRDLNEIHDGPVLDDIVVTSEWNA